MTKEEMNKDKAEVLKMVLEYKSNLETMKTDLKNPVAENFVSMGLQNGAPIDLKNTCMKFALCEIAKYKDLILKMINVIDAIGDSLIDAYSEGIKGIETED